MLAVAAAVSHEQIVIPCHPFIYNSAIAIYASLANWCTTRRCKFRHLQQMFSFTGYCFSEPFGSGRGSTAGCCGSCCNKSFDEDYFEEQVRKDTEKTRDLNGQQSNKDTLQQQQMAPSQEMGVNSD